MKLLLTSAGIKNTSINDALVGLLGKPIADSNALCIPTAGYGHPQGSPGGAWRFITGRASTPMCELGWKSLGVLELTALPSIDNERWVSWVRGDRRPAGEWRRCPVPVPLDAAVGAHGSPAVARQHGVGRAERRQHGDDPPHRPRLRRLEAALRWTTARWASSTSRSSRTWITRTLPDNTMANAEKWAAGIPGPAYAIDDQTAIKVADGTVEVVSEGHWKLFTS